ncbi:UDP-N-acetylmuramate--L-alanine ligase, partial [Candidatus Woesebacteria bacterium]|nr:UDP-N-acetylmuramate--L-alanine ligase [Candidatus Woesebacteria bacterium]
FIVSRFLGLKNEQIQKGLYKSTGSKRRFEKVGKSKSGALVYDDYAHHPTQIKSVLSAAKERFPKKRLISLFQPHTYTRTKALFDQFAKSFGQADIALFMDIYASAREFKNETVSSKALAKEVSKHKKESYYVGNHQGATRWLKKHTGPEDLILTLGAGDVFYIFEDLLGN